jgi:hypothetical protein
MFINQICNFAKTYRNRPKSQSYQYYFSNLKTITNKILHTYDIGNISIHKTNNKLDHTLQFKRNYHFDPQNDLYRYQNASIRG